MLRVKDSFRYTLDSMKPLEARPSTAEHARLDHDSRINEKDSARDELHVELPSPTKMGFDWSW